MDPLPNSSNFHPKPFIRSVSGNKFSAFIPCFTMNLKISFFLLLLNFYFLVLVFGQFLRSVSGDEFSAFISRNPNLAILRFISCNIYNADNHHHLAWTLTQIVREITFFWTTVDNWGKTWTLSSWFMMIRQSKMQIWQEEWTWKYWYISKFKVV